MSYNNQIFYFLIGDYNNKSELGHYLCEDKSISEDDKEYIVSQAKHIYKNFGEKDLGGKDYTILNNNQFCAFYSITSSGTFYLSVTSVHGVYMDNNNLMYELFEDIEHQGIKKLIDKNGNLSRVGNQNLKFSIEQNNNKMKDQSIEGGEKKDINKIVVLNNQINDINMMLKLVLKI